MSGFSFQESSFQVSVFRFQVQRFFLKPDHLKPDTHAPRTDTRIRHRASDGSVLRRNLTPSDSSLVTRPSPLDPPPSLLHQRTMHQSAIYRLTGSLIEDG